MIALNQASVPTASLALSEVSVTQATKVEFRTDGACVRRSGACGGLYLRE